MVAATTETKAYIHRLATLSFAGVSCVVGAMLMSMGAVAPSAYAAQAPLFTGGSMRVMVSPGVKASPDTTAVLVQTDVPKSVELPVRVRIPVPRGAQVGWAGEITPFVGEDVSRQHRLKQSASGAYVEITVQEYRTVQVDFDGLPLTLSTDGTRSARVEWTQTVPAPQTTFSVLIPENSRAIEIAPEQSGKPAKNESGQKLYSLGAETLAVGRSMTVTASYKEGAAIGDVSNPLTFALIVAATLLVLAACGLVFMLRKRER